jgi:hypothetical protein
MKVGRSCEGNKKGSIVFDWANMRNFLCHWGTSLTCSCSTFLKLFCLFVSVMSLCFARISFTMFIVGFKHSPSVRLLERRKKHR